MSRAVIESLDHEGRGVARADGKAIFIEGALPGELVDYRSFRKKRNYELATLNQLIVASPQRVSPPCPQFGTCGGCSMQHLQAVSQIAVKQRVLEDALWHIGRLRADQIYSPISGMEWQYRHRARLAVRCVPSKGGVLIGFHERRSSYIVQMDSCEVLPAHVSALIPHLKLLIGQMSAPDRLPQIEVSIGDSTDSRSGGGSTILVLRHLTPLTRDDQALLREFADLHRIGWYLQPQGPESAHPFYPVDVQPLQYCLPDFAVKLDFHPIDFTQVNFGVNRMLVRRAMALLQPLPGERIADMFCGLGNFSLPVARLGADVVGIEGSPGLVARAEQNAEANGLTRRCQFFSANLFDVTVGTLAAYGRFDKYLIDPPREGAIALVTAISEQTAPKRILYVSCNPATLARDAAVLVHLKGYALKGAGIACMFPSTSHVESIALFER